ncbi:DUF6567 family protein [uncultured Tenacibaculum sp.]|uniref:DUF6567 family protein n=1 Tax=uncultured Tenacibaculum sp. TaxID=174713 RepID=UPI002628E753|nr:DUF6567 family protein [uncultured Tenacibaculum sp.]
MKKILLLSVISLSIFSCKTSSYIPNVGQIHKTNVVLNKGNFEVLGSFSGTAYMKKKQFNFKNNEGILAMAKANLLENAKNKGIELKGSRALVNITTDIIEHSKKIKATITAEIIEFK